MTPYEQPDAAGVQERGWWHRILSGWSKFQWANPRNQGGVTVFVYQGGTTGVSSGGLFTYDTTLQPVATGSGYDYLTDINIWSRGKVATDGTITPNTTSILVGDSGGPQIVLAPGESITLRKKNPNHVFFKAGATTASGDSVVFFW